MDSEAKTRRISLTPSTYEALGKLRATADEPLGDVVTRMIEETSADLLRPKKPGKG